MTLTPPSAEQQKMMNCELSQRPEITQRDVLVLKDWLAKQPHLPNHMDDTRLERFLYGCKFSLERCKMMLERYYTVRANIPEFFANRDPKSCELQDCFENVKYYLLPGLTTEGYRVTFLSFNSSDMDNFNLTSIVKRIVMTLDARLTMESCLNNVMVIDLKNITMPHVLHTLPTNPVSRKGMTCIQDAFPMRMARLHFLNSPGIVDKVITLFSPLLKEKLMQKFVFHTGGGESLQKFMPKEILPLEYGGNAGTIEHLNECWQRKVESLHSWYLVEERISKANESKRIKDKPSNNNNNEIHTGISGSFRQLSLD